MKYYIKTSSNINTSLLNGLMQDILEQVYEDDPYESETDAYYDVLDNCILVITEMDEDEIYKDLKPFANYDNQNFCRIVKDFVRRNYNKYEWREDI